MKKTVKNVDSIKVWLHVISGRSGECLLLQCFWAKDATCRWSIVVSAKQVLPVHWNNNYVQMEDQITYLVQTSHQLRQIGWKADLFQLLNHCYSSGLLQYDTVSGLPGWKKTPGCCLNSSWMHLDLASFWGKQSVWCFSRIGPLETIQKDTKNCSEITNHNLIHRLPGAGGEEGYCGWETKRKH